MAWRGDFGYTDLLDRQDVPKYDLRVEVLGTVDEASSALGVVRAITPNEGSQTLILQIQSDLAATTEEGRPGIYITPERVNWLAEVMADLEAQAPLEPGFIAPGDSTSGGFVQLARTVVRRAERLVTLLDHEGALHNPQIIAYLNRLSALLFVLARYEDLTAGATSPTMAQRDEKEHEGEHHGTVSLRT